MTRSPAESSAAAARPITGLFGLLLMVAVPTATLLIGVSTSARSPHPYLLICALHLVMLLFAAATALAGARSKTSWRGRDLIAPGGVAIGTVLSLLLTFALAGAHGIRGSAMPRLRQGIPLPPDLPYAIAVGLAVTALVAAAAAALAPLVPTLRRALADRKAASADAPTPSPAQSPSAPESGAPVPARPVKYATTKDDGILRRLLSPLTRVLIVLCSVAMLGILLVFSLATLDRDTADLLSVLLAFAPAPAMLWAVIESLWHRDEQLGPVMGALWRTVAAPPVIAVLACVPSMLASLLPPVWQGYSDQFATAVGVGGMLSASAPPPAHVAGAALVALGIGMVGGLALSVFVVIPLVALLLPRLMIDENEMSTSPEDRRRNIAAVRVFAALIVMIFVFAFLMTAYERGSVPGWAPFLAVGVLVVLTGVILKLQRVDHARRARSGTAARFRNPEDPPPELDQNRR